jgi:tetratricopeptide (TPR) repeat protein
MKLIRGSTLEDMLATDGPGPTRWLGVFEGICQAVGYAHAGGVIHRDLKPANVMVGSFGEVQVMDWGLAKVLAPGARAEAPPDPAADASAAGDIRSLRDTDGSLTRTGSVLGTPAYMPPEQAAGRIDRTDRRSDVFGLGAILCALLTGKPPYDGAEGATVWQNAVRGRTEEAFARLNGCGADPDLIALCKRCLALDPGARPATAAEVAVAVAGLRRAADDRAKQAERERLAAEVREGEQRKRRRVIGWAAAVVVAVFAGGVAAAVWQARVALLKAHDAELARIAETEERVRAQAAEIAAEGARAKADARLGKAVEAIEKMVTRVGTARWARDPVLAAQRRQVLEDAVAFYERFGEANDPVVRRETARAHRRIGAAYVLLAEYPKAAEYLERARAECEGLCAKYPGDSGYAADLAETRLFVAHEAASSGRFAAAGAAYRDAVAAARRAAAARPDDDTRRTLVSCLIGHGFLTMQQTDLPAAAPVFREAVGAADELLARPAPPFPSRVLAAYTYAAAATFAFARGEAADGIAKLKRAATIRTATPPDPAAPAHYQDLFDMTGGILTMADAQLLAAARPEQAAALYRKAAEEFERLLAVYPKAFQYQIYHLSILSQEVPLLVRLERTDEADRRRVQLFAAEEAVLKNAPALPGIKGRAAFQLSLVLVVRVRAGKVADLDRQADDLLTVAGVGPGGAEVRYNVACALALASRHGAPADREARAARAVRLLVELLDGPLYRGPNNAAHVAADADLDPVRDRADFRAFEVALRTRHPLPPPAAPPPHLKLEK